MVQQRSLAVQMGGGTGYLPAAESTMAGLHSAAAGYAGHGRPSWREHLQFAKEVIPSTEEAAHRELAVVTSALNALPVDSTCYGLIHFDLEADNMRWQDGVPAIFDFDDSAHYWFVADVAYALRDLYDDRIECINLADPRLQAFVVGYRAVRPLPERELERRSGSNFVLTTDCRITDERQISSR